MNRHPLKKFWYNDVFFCQWIEDFQIHSTFIHLELDYWLEYLLNIKKRITTCDINFKYRWYLSKLFMLLQTITPLCMELFSTGRERISFYPSENAPDTGIANHPILIISWMQSNEWKGNSWYQKTIERRASNRG